MKKTQLQKQFRDLLLKECQKNNLLGVWGTKLLWDSFLLLHGKLFVFKIGSNPTKTQEYNLTLVDKCGGKSIVVHEDNYKKIINMIIRGGIITKKLMSDAGMIKNLMGKNGGDKLYGSN